MNRKRYPAALTIAGSDSGGGAGIQADLKTFAALGVYGTSVITAITAQNTCEVRKIENLPEEIIRHQIESVLDDITVDAVKTGMLPTPETIGLVAAMIDRYRLKTVIIDPVMTATTGARLTTDPTGITIRHELFKRATLITPNTREAEILSGIRITHPGDIVRAAAVLTGYGCEAVLMKGGHIAGESSDDILFRRGYQPVVYSGKNIPTGNLHGTGCTLSSAIAAFMALGNNLENAVGLAKEYISEAIEAGSLSITGKGNGPVNHFFNPQPLKTIPI